MNFDLKTDPPTAEQLSADRPQWHATLSRMDARVRLLWRIAIVVWVMGCAAEIFVYLVAAPVDRGMFLFSISAAGGVLGMSGAFLLAKGLLRKRKKTGSADSAATFVILLGTFVVFLSGFFLMGGGQSRDYALSNLGLIIGVFVSLLIAQVIHPIGICFYDFWIDDLFHDAKSSLYKLEPLDPASSPDQCVDFYHWAQENETVKAYQHKLARLGRKPTIGEYLAAKACILDSERLALEIERVDLARLAYAKMSEAI